MDQTIIIESKENKLAVTPLNSRSLGPVNTQEVQQEGNQITYQNIYNGVNLIYTTSKDQVLEEYEVKTKREGLTEIIQKIDITGLTWQKQSDGSIKFFKSNSSRLTTDD